MAFGHTTRFKGARTARVAAGWRRATVAAAGVLVAAALIGPSAAKAGWSTQTPGGGHTPAGYGSAPTNGGGGVPRGGGVPEPSLPAVSAQAAIVVDRATGEVLGAKNPDAWRAPASVTKIMTALIASEAITAGEVSLSDTVTIPADVSFEIWDADVALRPGDTISLRDLLYMMLVNSEGDAATSVAMHVGGYPSLSGLDAREAFIERMNDRADELGLRDTSFVNVSGADPEDLGPSHDDQVVDDDQDVPGYEQCTDGDHFYIAACAHYSTARDLAALTRVVLDDPLLARIVSTPSWTTTTWRRTNRFSGAIALMNWSENNTNQLLPGLSEAYAGAYGVKTGTSGRAGENLVSAATNNLKPAPPAGPLAETATPVAATPPQRPGPSPAWPGPAESNGTDRGDVIAVVLGSDTADRFVDSKIVLDFALSRAP
jgi:D-alanyl-D-alanine carboxypeptidase